MSSRRSLLLALNVEDIIFHDQLSDTHCHHEKSSSRRFKVPIVCHYDVFGIHLRWMAHFRTLPYKGKSSRLRPS